MATKLFLRSDESNTNLDGLSGEDRLGTSAGPTSDSVSRNTVTGPTAGLRLQGSGVDRLWVSNKINSDITISSTVTFNIWASESNMSANATIECEIIRIQPDGTLTTIVRSERGTELGTTLAANNWTATPTSTALVAGDRVGVRLYANDATATTMATGFSVNASFGGTTGGADGDSFIQFTETFTLAPRAIDTGSIGIINVANKVAGTSIASTYARSSAIGETIFIGVGLDNVDSADGETSVVSAVSDTAGNTYTKIAEYTNAQSGAGTGATVSLWQCKLTNAVTTANTLTATHSSVTARAMSGVRVVDADSLTLVGYQTDAVDNGPPANKSTAVSADWVYLTIFAIASEAELTTMDMTYTPGADTLTTLGTNGGSWDEDHNQTGGGTSTTNMGVSVAVSTLAQDAGGSVSITPQDIETTNCDRAQIWAVFYNGSPTFPVGRIPRRNPFFQLLSH